MRAVREGIRRDGQHLYPAFPYTSYTALSRDDVLAIKAYLMTLPAIAEPNRANDLGFPFNQRWAMSVLECGILQEPALRPGRLETGAMEQRRLSRHRARPLRRMPHAAQLRLRPGAWPRACRRGAPGLARLQHHLRCQVWYRRLVRRRHRSLPHHGPRRPSMPPRPAPWARPWRTACNSSTRKMPPRSSRTCGPSAAHEGKHPVHVDSKPAALASSTPMLPASDELTANTQGLSSSRELAPAVISGTARAGRVRMHRSSARAASTIPGRPTSPRVILQGVR